MATVIEKDVLWPGTVVKNGRRYVFRPEDLLNAATTGTAKINEGWTIPLSWDHHGHLPFQAKDLTKDQLAELTKNTFGRIKLFKKPGREVQASLEIDDDADLKALKSIRNVSPMVQWDWEDSYGKKWPGLTIAHVAATGRPVVKDQKAFALGHGETLVLSFGDYDMADEADDTPKDEPKETTETETETPESGKAAELSKALEILAMRGLTLPEDTTMENLLERIIVAGTALEGAEEEVKPEDTPQVSEVNEPAPITMSHAQTRAMARVKAADRKQILGRISRLTSTGRILPVKGQKMAGELNKVELSYTDDGDLAQNSLLIRITELESQPANSAWSPKGKKVDLSHAGEVNPPKDLRGDVPPKKTTDEILADYDKTLGR